MRSSFYLACPKCKSDDCFKYSGSATCRTCGKVGLWTEFRQTPASKPPKLRATNTLDKRRAGVF